MALLQQACRAPSSLCRISILGCALGSLRPRDPGPYPPTMPWNCPTEITVSRGVLGTPRGSFGHKSHGHWLSLPTPRRELQRQTGLHLGGTASMSSSSKQPLPPPSPPPPSFSPSFLPHPRPSSQPEQVGPHDPPARTPVCWAAVRPLPTGHISPWCLFMSPPSPIMRVRTEDLRAHPGSASAPSRGVSRKPLPHLLPSQEWTFCFSYSWTP